MKNGLSMACLQALRKFSVRVVLTLMLVSVSGAGGIFFQAIAWIDMSQKAGGIRYLTEVIIDATPCERCERAQRMLDQRGEGQRSPVVDWGKASEMPLYPAAVFNGPRTVLVPIPARRFAAHSEKTPDGFVGELPTPPPRSAS